MMIGYRNITIYGIVPCTVGLTYVRDQDQIEFLEGWINPLRGAYLHHNQQVEYILKAKGELVRQVMKQVSIYPDKQRIWEGVNYG
jgi:hypothetical protein